VPANVPRSYVRSGGFLSPVAGSYVPPTWPLARDPACRACVASQGRRGDHGTGGPGDARARRRPRHQGHARVGFVTAQPGSSSSGWSSVSLLWRAYELTASGGWIGHRGEFSSGAFNRPAACRAVLMRGACLRKAQSVRLRLRSPALALAAMPVGIPAPASIGKAPPGFAETTPATIASIRGWAASMAAVLAGFYGSGPGLGLVRCTCPCGTVRAGEKRSFERPSKNTIRFISRNSPIESL
jgi:hypothetical protein